MSETFDEEYWDVDGTSLHRLGWSIGTLSGLALPPKRGDDTTFANRPGREYRNKPPDSQTIALPMWVTGSDPATGVQAADPRLAWNDNWRALQQLVNPPGGGQVSLTRRKKLTVGGVPTVVSATAQAEYTQMIPSMTGRTRADFSLEFLLAVPYFFGSQVTTSHIEVSTPATINNPGDDIAGWFEFEIDFVGTLVNPKLTNSTPSTDVWVKYGSSISAGDTVTLDVESFTATRESDSENVIGNITHGGKPYWLGLWPGDNTITLTADSGSGYAIIRYKPPYV